MNFESQEMTILLRFNLLNRYFRSFREIRSKLIPMRGKHFYQTSVDV